QPVQARFVALHSRRTSHVHYVGLLFFFNDPPPTEIYTLSLHDALPIFGPRMFSAGAMIDGVPPTYANATGISTPDQARRAVDQRSEEHTSELQSRGHLVCRLLLEKKKRGGGARSPARTP